MSYHKWFPFFFFVVLAMLFGALGVADAGEPTWAEPSAPTWSLSTRLFTRIAWELFRPVE
jgi:hypothetical protein